MPTLDALLDVNTLRTFAQRVASNVEKLGNEPVDVNGGVKTTEQLKDRLISGRKIQFDYQRLIDESTSYK
jgi:hypothetical protein